MIIGLGTDVCPAHRWARLIERHGERSLRRILAAEEADYILKGPPQRLAERMAGRWALREAFGKALGIGLSGWSWKELRFQDGHLSAEGDLKHLLAERKISHLHGSVSHDGGIALAVVILEGEPLG